ncbi:hypothetical protein HanXRQr2_Chr16g0731171 [Helianthus annuus]|uniref:Uncharacterized protein n=1 Tax=Helianthus annuus TaxID=4232 RepID=A0A9K3DNQ5_HELAN|nr:hypothetical protein HanXRQr2_Chr16g0731171 [Helianthus annuus]
MESQTPLYSLVHNFLTLKSHTSSYLKSKLYPIGFFKRTTEIKPSKLYPIGFFKRITEINRSKSDHMPLISSVAF